MATGKGVKALKGMVPITLLSGVSFVLPQLLVAKFIGAELAVVIGSVCSLLVTIVLGRKMKPDPQYELKLEQKETIDLKKALRACWP